MPDRKLCHHLDSSNVYAGFRKEGSNVEEIYSLFAGAEMARYNHKLQLARAAAVDRGLVTPANYGTHGSSKLLTALPYLDANNVWVIPIAHALLYGVVKDFWNLLLVDKKVGAPLSVPFSSLP